MLTTLRVTKANPTPGSQRAGFTLVEMTLVILVLLTLISVSFVVTSNVTEWRLGRKAAEDLRSVYTAQRMYLADHPTTAVADLTADMIIPYLPNHADAIPQVEDMDGNMRAILVNQSPPVVSGGGGAAYDPSGSATDLLWDVGE